VGDKVESDYWGAKDGRGQWAAGWRVESLAGWAGSAVGWTTGSWGLQSAGPQGAGASPEILEDWCDVLGGEGWWGPLALRLACLRRAWPPPLGRQGRGSGGQKKQGRSSKAGICNKYAKIRTEYAIICQKYVHEFRKYANICKEYANDMHKICTEYEENMQTYAKYMHLICTLYADICRKYAPKMQKICRNMHLICTWYAIKYARNMQEYARICIGAYFAFFAYILSRL
jgi:hypothetical protein